MKLLSFYLWRLEKLKTLLLVATVRGCFIKEKLQNNNSRVESF